MEGGRTTRELWAEYELAHKKPHPDSLNLPVIPCEVEHVYEWFLSLDNGRQAGMGLCPLAWTEIHAYFSLLGVVPDSDELLLLRAFDNAFIEVMSGDVVVDSI